MGYLRWEDDEEGGGVSVKMVARKRQHDSEMSVIVIVFHIFSVRVSHNTVVVFCLFVSLYFLPFNIKGFTKIS